MAKAAAATEDWDDHARGRRRDLHREIAAYAAEQESDATRDSSS